LCDVAVLGPLGSRTEEEDDGFLYLDIVDPIPGSDIELQLPDAIAAKVMRTQVSGINDSIDPALDSNSAGSIAKPVKPVLIKVVSLGIEVVENLHGMFAYKRSRVKDGCKLAPRLMYSIILARRIPSTF